MLMYVIIHDNLPGGGEYMQPEFAIIAAVPAKSAAHRALFCGSLAGGSSTLSPVCRCSDTSATIACLEGAGLSRIENTGAAWRVTGGLLSGGGKPLNAGESGTTLRFIIPLLLDGNVHTIIGGGRLLSRPLSLYERYCSQWSLGGGSLRFRGNLKSGNHQLPGNVSSQFASGLLMALARLDGKSTLSITPPVESGGYISLTRQVMRAFGVTVTQETPETLAVEGGQVYKPCDFTIEGDWSYAAALLAIGCNGRGIMVSGLAPDSLQPDRAVFGILQGMGAVISWKSGHLAVQSGRLENVSLDISQTPDLAPALAALMCTARGTSRIVNASRLRLKESDRLHALAVMLRGIGADITEDEDSLTITGRELLDGGRADAAGDHRIAMAAAIAALTCRQPVYLTGSASVQKSAPDFWQAYDNAGGAEHVIRVGQET
jgi:3-phosphoshikimate 1-carboxyvinyltransferase